MKKSDQRPQGDGAEARHDAYDQRKAAKNQEIDPPVVVTGYRAVVGDGCNREVGRGSRRSRHVRHNGIGTGQLNRHELLAKSMGNYRLANKFHPVLGAGLI